MSVTSSTASLRSAVATFALGALLACSSAPSGPPPPAAQFGGTSSLRPTPAPTRSRTTATAPKQTKIKFVVIDVAGRPRADIPIRYGQEGRTQSVVYSGANGTVTVAVAPSTYTAKIPNGCWPRVQVHRGQNLRAGVVRGHTSEIRLRVLEMEQRFTATAPVTWTPEPPWRSATDVAYSFTLWDECEGRPATTTSLRGLGFFPTGGLRVGALPARSDRSGTVEVSLRCATAGNATLMFGDRFDAADRVDILSFRRPLDTGASWCG